MKALPHAVVVTLVCLSPVTARADLFLAAFGGDAIYRWDGSSATLFAADPDPFGPNAMNGPTAMVYNAAGNLLVLNEFSDNVLEFNGTTGAFIGSLINSATLNSVSTAGIDPGDMEMGSDGSLYITSHFNNDSKNIHRFSSTTPNTYLGVFSGASPVHHTHGLAFGPGGNLYQGDVEGRWVDKFNGITGAAEGIFASGPSSMYPFADLAFSTTSLYVTSSGTSGVARFDAVSGAFIGYLPATVGSAHWGILVDGPDLWVSNTSTGSLIRFDAATGAFISSAAVGGGAFDIIAAVPEPGSAALLLSAMVFSARHMKRLARGRR